MISKQETLNLSPYMALYDLIIPTDNINLLVAFSFILDELKYYLDNDCNAIPPIRIDSFDQKEWR